MNLDMVQYVLMYCGDFPDKDEIDGAGVFQLTGYDLVCIMHCLHAHSISTKDCEYSSRIDALYARLERHLTGA